MTLSDASHDYEQFWVTVTQAYYCVLKIDAESNANVALTEMSGILDPAYKVVIGEQNLYTGIKGGVSRCRLTQR